ncbi:neutral zinc metallopeptidase [Kribbella sp. CA-247076]|uniref:neutral zinc metallopeptidase n=1 Tax=Kribbella sp. CA-247076 TaxID=3239941 RepID=UPI003D90250B
MRSTAKAAGLVVVAVLAAVVAGGVTTRPAPTATAATPSATASVTPSAALAPVAAPRPRATPSSTFKVDLSEPVRKNKLYVAGKVPAVRCPLPKANLASKTGILAYSRALVACMDRAWAPLIARSNAYFQPARVYVYSLAKLSATPACADPLDNVDAFYRRDGTICLEYPEFLAPGSPAWDVIDLQQLIAHEYGHHVQMSVGIMTAYDLGGWATAKAAQLETERRKELQASCLGAAFLGANKRTFKLTGGRHEIWTEIVHHVGDEYNPARIRDHGSRRNHGYWTTRAFTSGNPASCNTFTASAKRVS